MQINIESPIISQKSEYLTKIDVFSGEVRSKFLTISPGQDMIYMMKLNEAKNFPDGLHPFITSESLSTGKTEKEVVENILSSYFAWQSVVVIIESARIKAKIGIKQSDTTKEMYDIYQEFLVEIGDIYL